jgi:hypothetical protein
MQLPTSPKYPSLFIPWNQPLLELFCVHIKSSRSFSGSFLSPSLPGPVYQLLSPHRRPVFITVARVQPSLTPALHRLASRRQNCSRLVLSFFTRVSSPVLVPHPPFSTSRISSAFSDLALACSPRRKSPGVHARHLRLFPVRGVCRCTLVIGRRPLIPRPTLYHCVLHLLCRAVD